MKNERFTAQWTLVDSDQVVLDALSNATQLTSGAYALMPGIYEVHINASYWSSYFDLSDKTVVVTTTVNVTGVFLVAGIEGPDSFNASADETIQLSAYNLTYDPSLPRTDKSGMVQEWRCKRYDETWPADPPTVAYRPHNGANGGCFDVVGPGILGWAAGSWDLTFDMTYLELNWPHGGAKGLDL